MIDHTSNSELFLVQIPEIVNSFSLRYVLRYLVVVWYRFCDVSPLSGRCLGGASRGEPRRLEAKSRGRFWYSFARKSKGISIG